MVTRPIAVARSPGDARRCFPAPSALRTVAWARLCEWWGSASRLRFGSGPLAGE